MLIINHVEHDVVPLLSATPLSYRGSPRRSSCRQHSYIQYIILTVQTSTAVRMLVAGNAELDASPLPLPAPSHIVARPVGPPVGYSIHSVHRSHGPNNTPAARWQRRTRRSTLSAGRSLSHSGSHTHTPSTSVSRSKRARLFVCLLLATPNSTLNTFLWPLYRAHHISPVVHTTHIQHIVLTVQTNMSVHALVAGKTELDAQRFPLAALSHIQFHYFSCIVCNTHKPSTSLSRF